MTNTETPFALIQRKRLGQRLDAGQLQAVAQGIANGSWSDAQVGAFAMAVAWRGMTPAECGEFTLAVRDSGRRLDWSHLPAPVLDKHSTGGVGDCPSLLMAPMLAACGAYVPMIAGRGLAHTGGTLDKLESIPGYDVNPALERLDNVVRGAGCAIVGQGPDLVPTDRRMYAVRDVTATVDVLDLIVPSILSKKLAGGAQALVQDIKIGNGAQTPGVEAAEELAARMLAVARESGLAMRVALTDMDQVLGTEAGNAIEVREVLNLLCGRGGDQRLLDLSVELSIELLCMTGMAATRTDADARLRAALATGAAAERFERMVAGLGGPSDLLEKFEDYLPRAPVQRAVLAQADGFVASVDVRGLGNAIVELGGGRKRNDQVLDLAVGLSGIAGKGQRVSAGQPLALVHAHDDADAERVAALVRNALVIGDEAPTALPLYRWFEGQ